ncbi:hypothetical protein TNCT_73091 [Trichonephila clavata]|uniref:Uncharacterized protein n=1 Tax=Trichonephila clavata TaxID=2740835 RepID=A0A8X6KVY3_TRICU|nr:hypothetical protein TNCT_73091 [Trichonephila clavata]
MDEENEEMNIGINTRVVINAFVWLQIFNDIISSFQCKIPLYFSTLYFVIQFFIINRIPEHRAWRFEAVVLASFVFCHLCAKGATIFQIDVDADRELLFTGKRNIHLVFLFIIRLFRDRFREDDD